MESVEVWMWVIAGLLVGALVFASGSALMSRYLNSQEIGTARSNFGWLTTTAEKMCRAGTFSQETRELILPQVTERITVEDDDKIEGAGKNICIYIRNIDSPQCYKVETCTLKMNSFILDSKQTANNLLERI